MKTKTTWLAVLAVVTALTTALTINAQSRYGVTDLGTLPGLRNSFVWGGVNSQGHVAEYASDSTNPNAYAGGPTVTKRPPSPPAYLLWPSGAKLAVTYYPMNPWSFFKPRLVIGWPIAEGADHYRLTILKRVEQDYVVAMDTSPVAYVVGSDGQAHRDGDYFVEAGRTYLIMVTAYSGPDEAAAYSESLQARITAR